MGLAIKGATADEMKRGTILSAIDGVKTGRSFDLSFNKNSYFQKMKEGVAHTTIGMQTIPINVTDITNGSIVFESEKIVAYTNEDTFLIMDLNAKKLHLMGNGKIKHSQH